MLERLVPDAAFRAQLLGFWDAHPAVQQRFQGGVVHFAQWAGQMPEDALEDLFVAIDALEQEGIGEGGEMPGAMPGHEVEVNFVDPEDVEDEEMLPAGAQPQPRAAGAAAEDEDEDEDDNDEEEEEVAALPVRLLRSVINRFWGGGQGEAESSDEERQLRDTAGVD